MSARDSSDARSSRRTPSSATTSRSAPFAIVGEDCEIGDGCVIAPRATLERNVKLGAEREDRHRHACSAAIRRISSSRARRRRSRSARARRSASTRRSIAARRSRCKTTRRQELLHHVVRAPGARLSRRRRRDPRERRAARRARDGRGPRDHVRADRGASVRAHRRVLRSSAACSRVAKDIPPYLKAVGQSGEAVRAEHRRAAAQRTSTKTSIRELKRAYRLFFRSELNVSQAIERAQRSSTLIPRCKDFLGFVEESERGVVI